MAKHSSSEESSERAELEKKLRRREKKLRERLQEARDVQSDALDRLKRAERRLEKRTARTQSLETRLTLTQQQLSIMGNPGTQPARNASVSENEASKHSVGNSSEQVVAQPSLAEQSVFEEQNEPVVPVGDEREELEQLIAVLQVDEEASASENGVSDETSAVTNETDTVDEVDETDETVDELTLQVKNVVSPAEVGRLAKIARSVAETAERAARVAIERAVEVAARLEQMSAGRHLMQELTQTQAEADRASALAQQAQRAATEAERLMAETEMEETQETGELANAEEEMTEEQLLSAIEAMALEDEVFAGGDETRDDEEQEDEDMLPSPESIEDIEDEEEMIEAIASKLIADAAAAAAAQAEALAEASSSRTREARQNAARADRMLDEARAIILNGSLDEQEAQTRLQDAERASTRAHALLADAEAAEEAARNAARNAEAEAEVAEGMAFATGDIAEHQLEADIANLLDEQTSVSDENNANGDNIEYNDDNDATDKIARP